MVTKKTTVDLTPTAKSVLKRLKKRWSLRKVLSAGIIALDSVTAEQRELYIDIANDDKGFKLKEFAQLLASMPPEDLAEATNLLKAAQDETAAGRNTAKKQRRPGQRGSARSAKAR